MSALWSHARAVAQGMWELFHVRIWVRRWPPGIRLDDSGAQDRVEAVRAGTRRIGADR